MQEAWVQSLGWEESLEEGMATHSNILAWRIPMDRGAWQGTLHGVAESDTEQLSTYWQWAIRSQNLKSFTIIPERGEEGGGREGEGKYLHISLTKHVQNVYAKKYKMLIKEIKDLN